MLDELNTKNRVVGLKQTQRAISEDKVIKVFIADDADKRVTSPIVNECSNRKIPVETVSTMTEIGAAAGIDVGAAVAAVIK